MSHFSSNRSSMSEAHLPKNMPICIFNIFPFLSIYAQNRPKWLNLVNLIREYFPHICTIWSENDFTKSCTFCPYMRIIDRNWSKMIDIEPICIRHICRKCPTFYKNKSPYFSPYMRKTVQKRWFYGVLSRFVLFLPVSSGVVGEVVSWNLRLLVWSKYCAERMLIVKYSSLLDQIYH